RITTRLAHSRADVARGEPRPENPLNPPGDHRQFTRLPANARRNYQALLDRQAELLSLSETSPFNTWQPGGEPSLGIIASGLAGNYLDEVSPGDHPVVYIRQYPVPVALVTALYESCDELLVIEEGAPFIENKLVGLLGEHKPVHGRRTGALPQTGELTPDLVRAAMQGKSVSPRAVLDLVHPRPPQLCKGCPHIDTYLFLNAALEEHPAARVFSDIGCYTLGALPPFESIHTCVDMGASITMAKGASDAGLRPALAVIGDSTFTHSGMTGLLDAVHENTPFTVLILDNDTTGMTGQQVSMATGRLEQICLGLGVAEEHLRIVVPLKKNHEANMAVLREEIGYAGVSVIISRRACVQIKRRV
ncbi:MAG: thiamine pyrophosphate-dependent enzyme, partial [Kiritimatiellae bacterium]|nr:thiamine pyrophosphate-dependent enzyme [Kiritimatiellia bacterium]